MILQLVGRHRCAKLAAVLFDIPHQVDLDACGCRSQRLHIRRLQLQPKWTMNERALDDESLSTWAHTAVVGLGVALLGGFAQQDGQVSFIPRTNP
jgi:hypothetical protein